MTRKCSLPELLETFDQQVPEKDGSIRGGRPTTIRPPTAFEHRKADALSPTRPPTSSLRLARCKEELDTLVLVRTLKTLMSKGVGTAGDTNTAVRYVTDLPTLAWLFRVP
jgi:hypothetical protein